MSSINTSLFELIHNFSGRSVFLDGLGIFFAEWLPYFLVIGFFLLVLYQNNARRRFYLFAEATLAIIVSRGIITTTIHFFYYSARPFVAYGIAPLIGESGSSFPSAHAAWFFALAMTIWYLDRRWGVWYFTLATLMGIARVYAGVHWPIDVVAGAAIGIVSAIFIHWLLRRASSTAATTSTTLQPSESSPA